MDVEASAVHRGVSVVTDLSALVGKTVVAVEHVDPYGANPPPDFVPEAVTIKFFDGSSLVVRPNRYDEMSLDIDYDDGACHQDTGPLCLMGS